MDQHDLLIEAVAQLLHQHGQAVAAERLDDVLQQLAAPGLLLAPAFRLLVDAPVADVLTTLTIALQAGVDVVEVAAGGQGDDQLLTGVAEDALAGFLPCLGP